MGDALSRHGEAADDVDEPLRVIVRDLLQQLLEQQLARHGHLLRHLAQRRHQQIQQVLATTDINFHTDILWYKTKIVKFKISSFKFKDRC